MTFDEQVTWLAEEANVQKVRQAMVKAALDVSAEASSVAHHELRAELALEALTESDVWARRTFAPAVAANPALSTTPSDGDLQFSTNAVWDAIAGVPGPA
jgi:hypothetical protein